MPGVVVAVDAERLSDPLVVIVVGCAAPQRLPMGAASVPADLAVIAAPPTTAGVHGTVAGGGQRDEHLRAARDTGRDTVVTAGNSGVYELPGVTRVEV